MNPDREPIGPRVQLVQVLVLIGYLFPAVIRPPAPAGPQTGRVQAPFAKDFRKDLEQRQH